ncbi:Dam family site-specific DNA-(adenine-N6)-methyltransferase [Pasteurella caecimuris]|uniref:Dam family site-specific DNA-(adenine-N6)-methyltransferase n=1 Tax=Rodentibacter caecimuris TaxID=1796644 RepID=UPI0021505F1E|nr:Dam family site-specific DNA-(adenine-N6)-methyltransferase [Pasteurella caecimuris]MCR1837222.1 Dam family site-specific DNA-(adenine-N6)-methyltransferase [Pasteurella caecimuris]MCU0106275.1 Dam family site-specific DNA-(adenine-N6)-methyltransferase [Pasteurella caecimuris]
MENLSVNRVTQELGISKSYLYKIVKEKQIPVKTSKTGRIHWDINLMEQIKLNLDIEPAQEISDIEKLLSEKGLKQATINNRRYLGNKFSLISFIKNTVEKYCKNINIIVDIFSGTGAVAHAFQDKMIITNDLLFSNYICHLAWFLSEDYSESKIIDLIDKFNKIQTSENNYMRENFSNTFFSADDCSKIGYIRENIEILKLNNRINQKEYAILITSLLYGMDKIANTVGHYDAYRKNTAFTKQLILPVILPEKNLNKNNQSYNQDANQLISKIECDLLYLDPPYNSRQYSDSYHLLENVAQWKKPKVIGVARKMDRSHLKSDYCLSSATKAFEELINKAKAKYILLSYNNMANKGNDRSNAKISDDDIFRILKKKGKVTVFEQDYKSFSTGKSDIQENTERLFLCEVYQEDKPYLEIASPLNYTGGKYKLLSQLKPLFPQSNQILDLFAGGCNVGINTQASKIIFNDNNQLLIGLMRFIKSMDTELLLNKIESLIKQYSLSQTDKYGYAYYQCESSIGLAKYNKEAFLKLRADFNQSVKNQKIDYALLYILIIFSFNNQIRFNRHNEFNLPVGKRDFNSKMKSKLRLFSEALKHRDVHFTSQDFREIDFYSLDKDTFIYCDPPYLITTAGYNENNYWTEKDESDLLDFLKKVHSLGFKFGLSNVLISKNKENTLLSNWIKENKFKIHYLEKSYANSNYQRKEKESVSQEVFICNYGVNNDY